MNEMGKYILFAEDDVVVASVLQQINNFWMRINQPAPERRPAAIASDRKQS